MAVDPSIDFSRAFSVGQGGATADLHNKLFAKLQAGDLTELGRPSALLQAAHAAGGITSPADMAAFSDRYYRDAAARRAAARAAPPAAGVPGGAAATPPEPAPSAKPAAGGGFGNCVAEIVQAAGGALGRAEAQGILEGLEQEHARTGDLDAAAQRMADAERMAAAIAKRNALINLRARQARRARIERVADALRRGDVPDLARAIRAELVAIATPVEGGRFSAEAQWKTRQKQYVDGVVVELKRKGLLAAARSGEMEDDIARELFERSKAQAGDETAQPGRTKNTIAADIADTLGRYQTLAKDNLNRAGAWIGDYAGYIARTSHNMDKIRRAGFEQWRDTIMPALDQDRTFEGVQDRDAMMLGAWKALSSGIHLGDTGAVGLKDPAFVGPANLARKVSGERTFHFKDADGWMAYQRAFGNGSLLDNVMGSLERSARQETLISRWGTNPEAEFAQDIQHFREQYRGSDAAAKLGEREPALKRLYSYLDGSANRPEHALTSQITSGLRSIKSMASLGAVAFTHLSAGVTKAAELRYQGVGMFDRHANFITSMLQGRGKGEARELADLMLAGTEGMHGHLMSRFQVDDTHPGTLSGLAAKLSALQTTASDKFFRASGLTYLLDGQKAGAQRIMARHLGMMVDREFADLPAETQRAFLQYRISPDEWDALRTAPDHVTVDGRVHLTPDAAMRATPEAAQAAAGIEPEQFGTDVGARAEAGARDALALKLHAYYADVADRSIISPGIAEKAMLLQGTRPGTVLGEALRFVAQFKTWGLAASRATGGRILYGGQGKLGAFSDLAQLAAGAALLGYTTMTLKDLTSGKNPRPISNPKSWLGTDWKTWAAALIQGGGFGILGDYLFGEYSRTGGGIGSTLLGPTLGQGVSDVTTLWNDMKSHALDGNPHNKQKADIGPDLLRIAQGWTPFINLFYTKMAMQYGLVHELQEYMNPGYLRRSEQRTKREQGQTYWLSPTAVHQQGFGAAQAPSFSLAQ